MNKKERTIKKASELGKQNQRLYFGCAQSSFAAIVDALRAEANIELVTPEEEEKIFKGLVGLEAGVGATARGGCGAVCGASFTVSLAAGVGREEQLADIWTLLSPCEKVRDGVVNRFREEFGSIDCREIQFAKFGRVYDFWNEEALREYLKMIKTHPGCQNGACTIAKAAGWAVEEILEIKGVS
jgi:hypothetical protein